MPSQICGYTRLVEECTVDQIFAYFAYAYIHAASFEMLKVSFLSLM